MKKSMTWIIMMFMIGLLYGCEDQTLEPTNPVIIADRIFTDVIMEIDLLFTEYQEVTGDITLPKEFIDYPDLNVIWTSEERSIINHNGVFKAPNQDTEVNIKVNLIYGDYMFDKTYKVIAKAVIIDDDDDTPIEKPEVTYETVMVGLSTLALHTDEKDEIGSYQMSTFFGIQGIIVGLSGLNQAFMYSEGAFIIIEGLLGVEILKQDYYYHISGLLTYENHIPKLIIDPKRSTILEVEVLNPEEPIYQAASLESLTVSNPEQILFFVQAVIIEGYLEQYELRDSEGFIVIPVSTDYDGIFEARYVRIQSIVYFDSTQQIWLFVDDAFIIEETLEPCPACVI